MMEMTVPRPRLSPMPAMTGSESHAADQKAADRQDRAGSDDGREREVERFNDGVAVVHLGLGLLEAAGDDDGVVDVRAHLIELTIR